METNKEERQSVKDILPVNLQGIPHELRELNQWLVWNYVTEEGKHPRKVPCDPRTGKWVNPTDPACWTSFLDAARGYQTGKYSGIGFGLLSGIVAIDMDNAIVNGKIIPPFDSYVASLSTYFELSPSGNGLRGFIFGSIKGSRRRSPANKLGVELYESKRFVTTTGIKLHTTPHSLNADQGAIDLLYNHLFPVIEQSSPKREQPRKTYQPRDESLDAIIRKAENAKNGSTFKAFMDGRWESLNRFPSKSEADFSFSLLLAYWTN